MTIIFCSCGKHEWYDKTVYLQKIENSSNILYKYSAWAGRDGHFVGLILLDSIDNFEINDSNKLPFLSLKDIPNKNTIKGFTTNYPKTSGTEYYKTKPIYTPINNQETKEKGIVVSNSIYQYRGYSEKSGGYNKLIFENFKETKDSLFFYKIYNYRNPNSKFSDVLKFKKLNITIYQKKDKLVQSIDIEDTQISKTNNKIISNIKYSLFPNKKIKSNQFSNYGIFKQIE